MLPAILSLLARFWRPIAAILGLWAVRADAARDARHKAKSEAMQEDYEHADAIRTRVRDNRADSLRKHDDAGWRD